MNIEAAEQNKLRMTLEVIQSQIHALETRVQETRDTILEQGRDFMLQNPFGALYGEADELKHSQTEYLERTQKDETELALLRKMLLAPYFARVDFLQVGENEAECLYFGMKNLMDTKTLDSHVLDWRSPIASLFYQDFSGDAWYDAPRGRIYGKILLKRQFQFADSALLRYVDNEVKIDDSILLDTLAQDGKQTLKVIISSIQREQNEAIRYGGGRNLLVTGPAGSGKTSVGLHRIAFLLYQNRGQLHARQTLMLTGSRLFRSYIADIIPELGEEDILKDSSDALLQENFPGWQLETGVAQAEALLANAPLRRAGVQSKYHPDFLRSLEQAVATPGSFVDLFAGDVCVLRAEDLRFRYQQQEERYAMQQKQAQLQRFAAGVIDTYFRNHRTELLEQMEKTLPVYEDGVKALQHLQDAVQREGAQAVQAALTPDFFGLYIDKLCDFTGEHGVARETAKRFANHKLYYEDAVVLQYLRCFHGNAEQLTKIRHVLLDEAQDSCEPLHRILHYTFPKAQFTILADGNQGILPAINSNDAARLSAVYGSEHIQLKKSYRSTREIGRLALRLLEGEPHEIMERPGEPVAYLQSQDFAATIAQLLQREENAGRTNCVLVQTQRQAQQLYKALRPLCEIQLLREQDETVKGNILLPVILSKGLEFDHVILPGCDEIDLSAPEGRRLLYLMITRALHRLTLLFQGKPSFFA